LSFIDLTTNEEVKYIYLYLTDKEQGSEKLSNLPKVTWLVSSRTEGPGSMGGLLEPGLLDSIAHVLKNSSRYKFKNVKVCDTR
jgi:hypothetical protein